MKITKSRLKKIIKEALLKEQSYKTYKIKKGDTLSQIAQKANLTGNWRKDMKTIAKINKIKNVDFIRAGDTLKMPVKKTRDLKPGEVNQDTDQHGEPLEPISNKRSGAAGGVGRMLNRDEYNRVKKSLGPRWDRMVKKYGESEARDRVINYMDDLKGDDIQFTVDGGVKKPETLVQKLMRLRKTKIK